MHFMESFVKQKPNPEQKQSSEQKQSNWHSKQLKQEPAALQSKTNNIIYHKGYVIESFGERAADGYTTIKNDQGKVLFEGMYADRRKNGYGIEYDQDGSILYEGYYRDDDFEGWGQDKHYRGEFKRGLYEGFGIYSSHNQYYEGHFKEGEYDGEGIGLKGENMRALEPIPDAHQFLNSVINQDGVMSKYQIDEVYIGEWANGLYHGFGRLIGKEIWYLGQFCYGRQYGIGTEQNIKTKRVTKKLTLVQGNGEKE